MIQNSIKTGTAEAMSAAKLAVGRYARDPSDANAEQVTLAWRRVRSLSLLTRPNLARPGSRWDKVEAI